MARVLFLVLAFLTASAGWKLTSRHACWNATTHQYQLTNCCARSEVFGCYGYLCLVAHGCTICTQEECWHLAVSGFSMPPNTTNPKFMGPIGPMVLAAYICEGMGVGEFCAACTIAYQLMTMTHPFIPDLVCNTSCQMHYYIDAAGWASGNTKGFWLSDLISFFLSAPRACWAAIEDGAGILVLMGLIYLLEDRPVRACLLLIMVVCQYRDVSAFPVYTLGGIPLPWQPSLPARFLEPCSELAQYPNGSTYWREWKGSWQSWSTGRGSTLLCKHDWMVSIRDTCEIKVDGRVRGPVLTSSLQYNCPQMIGVRCDWGSMEVWAHNSTVYFGMPPVSTSCTCKVYKHPGSGNYWKLIHTFVVSKRERHCGSCVRDCWPDTPSLRLRFEHCGVGTRFTANFTGLIGCTIGKDGKPRYRTPSYAAHDEQAEARCRDSAMPIGVAGRIHVVTCPDGASDAEIPAYMPGDPVTLKKDTRGYFNFPLYWVWQEAYFNVCRGYAHYYEDGIDGLVHYNRHEKSWHQPLRAGVPPDNFLLGDYFLVLLIMLKLMGSRWVTLCVMLIWMQLAPWSHAAPLNLVRVGEVRVGLSVDLRAWAFACAFLGYAIRPSRKWALVLLVGFLQDAEGALFPCRPQNCLSVNWTHLKLLMPTEEQIQQPFVDAWDVVSSAVTSAWKQVREHSEQFGTQVQYGLAAGAAGLGKQLGYLAQLINGTSGVHAAPAAWIATGPMLSAAYTEASLVNVALVLLNFLVYLRSGPFGRLCSMVGFKLYRGWFAATIIAVVGWARRRHSTAGSCRICVEVEVSGGWSPSWTVALIVSYTVLTIATFTGPGKRIKLEWYAKWARFYGWVYDKVVCSPVGRDDASPSVILSWWGACAMWPHESLCVAVWLYTGLAFLDAIDMALEAGLVVDPQLPRIARLVETLAEARNLGAVKFVLDKLQTRGILLYHHMGQVGERTAALLREAHACLEPAFVTAQDLEEVRDTQFILACGSMYGGKPVVARRGDSVLIGHSRSEWTLPPGYTLTAPLLLRREGKNAYRVLLTSMRGRDEGEYHGQVIKLGTALTRSFGTCIDGMMYTTAHSANARSLATADGPVYPRWMTTAEDIAAYPMPRKASCLDICGCATTSAWAMTRDGDLAHGKLNGNTLLLDTDRRLSEFKGSSGSPVMCDQGHCVGMMVSVMHSGPRVHTVRFVKPWTVRPRDAVVPTPGADLPLPGKEYRVEGLHAPTGSGKSTRIPCEYIKHGYKVVVVNPSVATTVSMSKYIPAKYGVSPSVFAGHGAGSVSIAGTSGLTYITYGRLLAGGFQALKGADVVILDECHSTDPTSILGLGGALREAPTLGVRLMLLATATPPGTHMAPHPDIEEAQLNNEGDVPFYGLTLDSEKYAVGRHLIFCHSKAECERVALALSKHRARVVTFYRGKPLSTIPETGDVVVVATDALSTGYTGNFDTVTDCCACIEEECAVDLAPTITISVRTKPANAAVRLQRRGRTGRGRKGVYYYVAPEAPPTGTAPSGAIWQAAEAGVAWFNLSDRTLADYLQEYDDCPWTCIAESGRGDAVRFMSKLRPFRTSQEVAWMQAKGYNWPLLCGAQLQLCLKSQSGPPSKDERWEKCKGEGKVPLIARWGGSDPETVPHDLIGQLQEALGVPSEYLTTGPALLVGAAVACAAALVNYTGCLVPIAAWKVGVASEGELEVSDFVVEDALTAIETLVGWDAACDGFTRLVELSREGVAHAAHTVRGWWGPIPAAKESWMLVLSRVLHSWSSSITGGVAILTSRTSPVLASFSMFASGMMACLGIETRVVIAALSGALTSMIAGPGTGVAIAGAYLAGGLAGARTTLSCLATSLCGWEAAVTGARVAFATLNGDCTKELLVNGLVCLTSPGASVAGGVIGTILYHASSGKSAQRWTNRILSALPRTQLLPDDFFESGDPKEKVERLLSRCSLIELVKYLIASTHSEGVMECSSGLWELAGDLAYWVRGLLERLLGWCRAQIPSVGVPIYSCQTPYRGGWKGSGTVVSKCPCGNSTVLQINDGKITWRRDTSRLCWAAIRGGVPINVEGASRGPVPVEAQLEGGVVARFPYGMADWIEICYTEAGPMLVATTTVEVTRSGLLSSMKHQPVLVGGVSRSWRNYHTPMTMTFTAGAVILFSGTSVLLPHRLTEVNQLTRDPGRNLEPADAAGDVTGISLCPPANIEPSEPSVLPEEPPEPGISFTAKPGYEQSPVTWDPNLGTEWGDLWVTPRITVRQFKAKLNALTGFKVPVRVMQFGEVLKDSDTLPVIPYTVKMEVDDPALSEDHPLRKLGSVSSDCELLDAPDPDIGNDKGLIYHLKCCGTDITVGMPWHDHETLLDVVLNGSERDMYWYANGYGEGRPYDPWTKEDFLAHVPVLDGQRVSWNTSLKMVEGGGTYSTLKLVCNHPKSSRGVKKGDERFCRLTPLKAIMKCCKRERKQLPMVSHAGSTYGSCMFSGEYELKETHYLTIDDERVSWLDRVRVGDSLKHWELHCTHEEDDTSMPPLEEFDEVETSLTVPSAKVVMPCRDNATVSVLLQNNISWIINIMSHLNMRGVTWRPEQLRKHKLFVGGSRVDWGERVVVCDLQPDVLVEVKCDGTCDKPRERTDEKIEVNLHITCCGMTDKQLYAVVGDKVGQVLETAGLSPGHHIRFGGRAYGVDECFPYTTGKTVSVVCTEAETKCVQSYIWSGAPLALRELVKRPPTTSLGGFLKANVTRAYRTDPARVGERINTVTKEQTVAREDRYLLDAFNAAVGAANRLPKTSGYTYEEAISKVRPRAAPGHNVKLTVEQLKTDYGKRVVMDCFNDIIHERGDHPFCLATKQEVFPMTKKTPKPPRLICYPSLEFRVAEKMIMGDPGVIAKAVVGKAYGFIAPKDRCKRMLEMWREKRHPMAITVDAKVFDSSITAEDVERETKIYAAAHNHPEWVHALGKRYASGLMCNTQGQIVGQRNCRASGVLTTSSSNTITSYIKVSAACRAVGIPNPSFLIAGDDCLIVCEECDLTEALKAKLKEYGYDSEPQAHGSLSTAETCSTYMAEFYSNRQKEFCLSTNMERAIARASSEWSDPIAVAGGYTLMYPQHPVTRYLLMVQLLALLFYAGKTPDTQIVCDVTGNSVRFPLRALPNIIVGLHGPAALRVTADSQKTLAETHKALQIMGCRGLNFYKRRHARLRVALLRAGGDWALLAKALMWDARQGPPVKVNPVALDSLEFIEQRYQGYSYQLGVAPPRMRRGAWWELCGLCCMAVITMFFAV